MAIEKPVRCDVVFRGRVQGVGFRFTTAEVAKRFMVSGYVMNLRDGTVRMVAEGAKAEVSKMIRSVRNEMEGYVLEHAEEWGTATGEFPDFRIRHEGG
jgi:acylphosphatase